MRRLKYGHATRLERLRKARENIVERERGGRRDNMRDTRMCRAWLGPLCGPELGARFCHGRELGLATLATRLSRRLLAAGRAGRAFLLTAQATLCLKGVREVAIR